MSETQKKILFIVIFAIGLLIVIMRNNHKNVLLIKNAKYTVVKILDAKVHGKNDTEFTFNLYGQILKSYGKLLWRNERQNIIGKKVLLEYDSTNIKNNKILINVSIPDSLQVPINGWKYKPVWATNK